MHISKSEAEGILKTQALTLNTTGENNMKLRSLLFGASPEKRLVNELNAFYAFAEEHPDDMRVHLRIADVLMKLGQRHKAIEQYIHAAELYEAHKLSQIAAAIYKQVLSIDPEQINTYHTLAALYRKEGIVGDAVATYEKLARHYCDRGVKDQVIETLEKMFSVDPQSVYVKKKIAKFYAEKKIAPVSIDEHSHGLDWELSDAITSGQTCHQKSNQQVETFFDLGAALQDELETGATALEHVSEAEGKECADSLAGFDEIFREIRHEGSAPGGQDDALYHYNLGTAFHKIGRYDEAIEELTKALEDPLRSTDSYLMLSACARELKLYGDAIRYINKGLRNKSLTAEKKNALYYEMAITYKMKGRVRKAHKLFKKIYEADSGFREVKQELAEVS